MTPATLLITFFVVDNPRFDLEILHNLFTAHCISYSSF